MSEENNGADGDDNLDPNATGGDGGDAGAAGDAGADGGDKGDGGAKPAFGESWREDLAAGDDKLLKRFGRFNSPTDLVKSYLALEQKLSSGETRGKLPENYTDEELASYREANGIPGEVEGYFKDMPDGLVIGDEDKTLFDDFAQAMHDDNVAPAVVHKAVEWYYSMQEKELAAQEEADNNQRAEVEDALRAEWGTEYRANLNTLNAYLEGAPEGLKDIIGNSRGPDGRALLNNLDFVQWMAQKAREENPYVTLTPQGGDNTSLEDELAELTKLSGIENSEYWKGPKAEKMQARMREILDYKQRAKERDAA